jgi:uncharacterized membrane protein
MVTQSNPPSTAKIGGHPLHPLLVPFPIAAFVGAFACDAAYWFVANAIVAEVAVWLIGIGLVGGAIAGLAGVIDFLGSERVMKLPSAKAHGLGNGLLLALEAANFGVHHVDGQGIVPTGLLLSVLSVCVLSFTGWKGGDMVFKSRVGVL